MDESDSETELVTAEPEEARENTGDDEEEISEGSTLSTSLQFFQIF